jgi:hypothetical protein
MLRHSYSESFHGKTPQALDICLSCRRELSYFGVKVAIIEPGGFKTCVTSSDRLSSNTKMIWDKASSEVKEIYGEKFLLFCEWILGEQSQLESTILNLLLVLPAAPPPPPGVSSGSRWAPHHIKGTWLLDMRLWFIGTPQYNEIKAKTDTGSSIFHEPGLSPTTGETT